MYAVASDVRYDLHGVYVDYILPASGADLSFWPRLPACRKVWSKPPSNTDDDNDHKNDSYTAAGAAPGASVPCSLFRFLRSGSFVPGSALS